MAYPKYSNQTEVKPIKNYIQISFGDVTLSEGTILAFDEVALIEMPEAAIKVLYEQLTTLLSKNIL
jgi:hypothetical protein